MFHVINSILGRKVGIQFIRQIRQYVNYHSDLCDCVENRKIHQRKVDIEFFAVNSFILIPKFEGV